MRDFDVQTIEIAALFDAAFQYISEPRTLPEWTRAFQSVSEGRVTMVTPKGSIDVALRVDASRRAGTVDWSEALRLGRVAPGQLLFASDRGRARQFPEVLAEIRRLEEVRRAAALFRSHPRFAAPDDLAAQIRKLVEARERAEA